MKHIRFFVMILLALCLTFGLSAYAEEKLEIVQVRQVEDQLVLYTLLTDADTGDVVTATLSPQQVKVTASQFGDAQTLSAQPFSQTKEGVAYVVAIDMNSYAFNAVKLSALQNALSTFLNTLRDADRMMLLSIGKSGVTVLSSGFEKNRLNINNLIKALTLEDKYRETCLYQGIERAIGAFSSTEADFPVRKSVLVFTYGADNGSIAPDVLADKAGKSGVPIYFITMKGKDASGNTKAIDTVDLDRIARASHGRVLDGKADLDAAVTLFSKYIAGTNVITVKPSQATWNALSAQWNVSINLNERNVVNDADENYAVVLSPTPTPAPTYSRSIAITWDDNTDQSRQRPASVTARLLLSGVEAGQALTLDDTNGWKGTWDKLTNSADYTVSIEDVSGYELSVAPADAQGLFLATATLVDSPASVSPQVSAQPTRVITVSLVWDDRDNADNLRPDAVEASILKDSVDLGDPKILNTINNFSASWDGLPDNGAVYTVTLGAIERYALSAPSTNGSVITYTASYTPATLIQKLISPPLLYVVIGVVILLFVLLTLLLVSRKHEPLMIVDDPDVDDEPADIPHAPSSMDLTDDERTRPMNQTGEETLGMFAEDAERTLAMDDQRLRIDAEIDFQGQKKQQPLLLLSSLTLGRAPECGLILEDPRISRKHCKLTLKLDGLYIVDLGSRSGTFLNDQQVVAEKLVKTGDTLTLGQTRITLNIRK